MRARTVAALLTAAAVAGALLLAPSSAFAASATLTNPLATGSATDLDIPSVDVNYTSTAAAITVHMHHFAGPGYQATFFLGNGPVTSSTGDAYAFEATTTTGPGAPVAAAISSSAGFPGSGGTMADFSGITVTSDVAAQTITASVPSNHIFWSGALYVGVLVEDASTGDGAYAFAQMPTSTFVGLGPVLRDPTMTSTGVTLTSASQVYGSTPAAVSVTVTPAATGTAEIVEGTTVVATTPVPATGSALVILPSSLASGSHALSVRFIPSDSQNFAASTSVPFGLTVVSVAKSTKATVSLSKKSQVYKKKSAKITVSLSHKATGKVTILDGKKKLKTLSLKKGKASYTFSKKLKKGTHKIKVVYTPTNKEAFKASISKTVVLKVTK